MKKYQAAIRDRAAGKLKENRLYFRVGGVFKACNYCESYNVFRSYSPRQTDWTWKCMDCGSIDLQCWAPDANGLVEAQLGQCYVGGTTEAKQRYKKSLLESINRGSHEEETVMSERDRKIKELEDRLNSLLESVRRSS